MREFVLAFHYNDFVCFQSAFNHSDIFHFRSRLDKTLLYCRIRLHHIDKRTAFLDGNRLCRHCYGILPYIQEHSDIGKLSREEFPVRIRHFGADRECSGFRINERVGEVHQALEFILGLVCHGYSHIRIPMTAGIFLADIYVSCLGFLIVKVGHLEFHQYGITLHDIGKERLCSRTHQGSDIHVPFTNVTAYR